MTCHGNVMLNSLCLAFVSPQLDMFKGYSGEKANGGKVTWKPRQSKAGCFYNFAKAKLNEAALMVIAETPHRLKTPSRVFRRPETTIK